MTPTPKEFANWLERKFIDWMADEGRVASQGEFAEYLGISQPLLNKYLNGRRTPGKDSIDLMANKLGDEIYEKLELEKPDPMLQAIIRCWDKLDEEDRLSFYERCMSYVENNEKIN